MLLLFCFLLPPRLLLLLLLHHHLLLFIFWMQGLLMYLGCPGPSYVKQGPGTETCLPLPVECWDERPPGPRSQFESQPSSVAAVRTQSFQATLTHDTHAYVVALDPRLCVLADIM